MSDPELARAWYSDLNFERKARAVELGRRLGKDPIQIALAYVLNQPWPVIPLIGPATLSELRHSLNAAQINLTPEEVQWLERG
jgi:aryl-alcohol dehydrogenase-like predicted oxidoreductase